MPTALIADDEHLLREQLQQALALAWPELEIIGEARNGEEAIALCQHLHPDIAFLDIRMPGCSGLEAARTISPLAHVVFVTAYDQYAVEAFERGALDYLLKPTEPERLEHCVRRLQQRLSTVPPDLNQWLLRLHAQLGSRPPQYLSCIQAGIGNSIRLIPVRDILFFKADDKYTLLQTTEGEALIRKPIRELVQELDPDLFWQIHRATLVRVDAIRQVIRDELGNLQLQLKDYPGQLKVSRSFGHLFRSM